jgi:hypothetical protein
LKSAISLAVKVSALLMTGTTAHSLLMADIMIQSVRWARGGGQQSKGGGRPGVSQDVTICGFKYNCRQLAICRIMICQSVGRGEHEDGRGWEGGWRRDMQGVSLEGFEPSSTRPLHGLSRLAYG